MAKRASNKKILIINMIAMFMHQAINIVCGFVVPKITLTYFGSEVYGLVSSVNQFLGYISLLEGGVGGVVMAALYKALSEGDDKKISGIMNAVERFFRKLALIYVVYAVGLSAIYPLIVGSSFSYTYVLAVVAICALGTFIQYMFSISYRLLLNADRRGAIVTAASITFTLVNTALTVVVARIYPQIHVLRLCTVAAYAVQPILFTLYVKRHYKLDKSVPPDKGALAQRWDGFGQNTAYFILTNTDIVLLTLCMGNKSVAVYSVYFLVINAIKNLLMAVFRVVIPIMGNILVTRTEREVNKYFDYFEFFADYLTTVAFAACIVLIVPFIDIYTSNLTDANYHRPVFAVVACMAGAVDCFREPFLCVPSACGHYRQTAKYAYAEAIVNIVLSVALVFVCGIVGVAIGTVVALGYRMIMQFWYLKKNILHRSFLKSLSSFLSFAVAGFISVLTVMLTINYNVSSYGDWIVYAFITMGVVLPVVTAITVLLHLNTVRDFLGDFFRRRKKKELL